MQYIDVVAGVIFNETRTHVLLALRKPGQHQGERWEFPGGKLEAGEDLQAGLRRELEEELGLIVRASTPRAVIEHEYPDKLVRLHFCDVTEFDGEASGIEGQLVRWVHLRDLETLRFPDANQAIVNELVATGKSRAGIPRH
ncbi:MAG: NUDIX domain-containing protein [Granulosicoccus sp.]|nr:NUDIX domain-containing protein [Granulosicoccus sp.]